MSSKPYKSKLFKSSKSNRRLACLIAGFGGKISDFDKAVKVLLENGYDVVAFEYNNEVLSTGTPESLPSLIDSISEAVKIEAKRYSEVLCLGVSLGAYVAFNVQRRIEKAKVGLYGTAGVSVSGVIFTTRVFSKIKKAFEKNGFDEHKLRQAWEQIEILEEPGIDQSKSLIVVLGKQDRIVRYKAASKIMERWRNNGTRVHYFGVRGIGHVMTIRWYKDHIDRLLKQAKLI